ncbi:MAG: ribonuclease HII [Acholeplasmataceae bacterium]|nr:ribonuclease HII [Candidatus Izemoplasmatales bacterium]NLF48614.1 ribonuclease HII [Acholeplasmataceae bacterium]
MLDQFEKELTDKGYHFICGVDEAGRGPLAGPVVAGAVILDPKHPIDGLNDSKKLSSSMRERLFQEIKKWAIASAVAIVSPETIDQINVLEASRLAMMQAIRQLTIAPDVVLSDFMELPELDVLVMSLVKGDSRSMSIAAGSILAKVTRDRLMEAWAVRYPEYGFAKHKGYPTKEHLAMLQRYGPCPIHRMSFKPVLLVTNQRSI